MRPFAIIPIFWGSFVLMGILLLLSCTENAPPPSQSQSAVELAWSSAHPPFDALQLKAGDSLSFSFTVVSGAAQCDSIVVEIRSPQSNFSDRKIYIPHLNGDIMVPHVFADEGGHTLHVSAYSMGQIADSLTAGIEILCTSSELISSISTVPQHAQKGKDFSITVTTSKSHGLRYQWYKDNSILKDFSLPTLRFSPLGITDSGSYFCVVTSECGSDTSEILSIKTGSDTIAPDIKAIDFSIPKHDSSVIVCNVTITDNNGIDSVSCALIAAKTPPTPPTVSQVNDSVFTITLQRPLKELHYETKLELFAADNAANVDRKHLYLPIDYYHHDNNKAVILLKKPPYDTVSFNQEFGYWVSILSRVEIDYIDHTVTRTSTDRKQRYNSISYPNEKRYQISPLYKHEDTFIYSSIVLLFWDPEKDYEDSDTYDPREILSLGLNTLGIRAHHFGGYAQSQVYCVLIDSSEIISPTLEITDIRPGDVLTDSMVTISVKAQSPNGIEQVTINDTKANLVDSVWKADVYLDNTYTHRAQLTVSANDLSGSIHTQHKSIEIWSGWTPFQSSEEVAASLEKAFRRLAFATFYRWYYTAFREIGSKDISTIESHYETFPVDSYYRLWDILFDGIHHCNRVLYGLKNANQISLDVSLYAEGTARFLRALYYWHIAAIWEQAPLITGVDNIYSAQLKQNDDLWEFIIADLQQVVSQQLLPQTPPAQSPHHATLPAAKALLGKCYLYQQNYSLAAAAFADILSNTTYDLIPLEKVWTIEGEGSGESLFEVHFVDNGTEPWYDIGPRASESQLRNFAVGNAQSGGWEILFPTQNFMQIWEPGDLRRKLWVYEEGDTIIPSGDIYESHRNKGDYGSIAKGCNSGYEQWIVRGFGENTPLIRYADVLLMYAECVANGAGASAGLTAHEAINLVRNRAWNNALPDSLKIETVMQKNNWSLMEAIKQERRKELCFEAHRLNDLLRWGDTDQISDEYPELKRRLAPPEQYSNQKLSKGALPKTILSEGLFKHISQMR